MYASPCSRRLCSPLTPPFLVIFRPNASGKSSERPFRTSSARNPTSEHGIASVSSGSLKLACRTTFAFKSVPHVILPTVKPNATPEEIREVVENPDAGGQIFSNAVRAPVLACVLYLICICSDKGCHVEPLWRVACCVQRGPGSAPRYQAHRGDTY